MAEANALMIRDLERYERQMMVPNIVQRFERHISQMMVSFNIENPNVTIINNFNINAINYIISAIQNMREQAETATNNTNKVKENIPQVSYGEIASEIEDYARDIAHKAIPDRIFNNIMAIEGMILTRVNRTREFFGNVMEGIEKRIRQSRPVAMVNRLRTRVGQSYENVKSRVKNSRGVAIASKLKTRMGQSYSNAKSRVSNYAANLKERPQVNNFAGNIMKSSIGLFKNIWNSSIGQGLRLGLSKDKETGKLMNGIKDKWNNTWSNMGEKLAPLLRPALQKITKILDGPAFQNMVKFVYVFLGALISGATILLDCLTPVINIISNIFSFMFDNAEYVLIILGAIATAITTITVVLGIYNAICKVHNTIITISKTVTDYFGKAQKALPIVFIISMIIMLITIFITLIATMEPVRKAVANLTRVFFDFIEWGINSLIEGLASAAEGIIRFAGNSINTFLNIFVNPFIAGINLIIGALNLLGANINKLDYLKVDFNGAAEATGKFIRKGKVDLSGAKEAVAGAIENFSAEELKKKLGIGKLQEQADEKDVPVTVNKIKDDVNIADEDVKLMRDVAEREMIQNFVTLTPTVSMGDMTVNENADADKLLGKITEALVTEVTNSAQGVYA